MSQIDRMGDPLANLNRIMNWEIFVPVLDRIPQAESKAPGGRPAFHPMFMFKILVLQSLYGLADEQIRFQILDRRNDKVVAPAVSNSDFNMDAPAGCHPQLVGLLL